MLLPRGADVVISPVLDIRPVDFSTAADRYDALVFASANGVRAAARCLQLAGAKAITAGDRTAEVAANFGMSVVSANGAAEELIATVVRECAQGKVLFVRGRFSRGDVAEALISRGIDTDSVIAYDQVPAALSVQAQAALTGQRRVILPLFSPHSAAILSAEVARCSVWAPLCLIAMSADILAAWAGTEAAQKIVARQRTAGAVADEIMARLADRS